MTRSNVRAAEPAAPMRGYATVPVAADTGAAPVTGASAVSGLGIIDTYLPRRTEVALSGIEPWEERQQADSSKAVTLAAKRRG